MKIETAMEADIPSINDLVHTCYRGEESTKGWTTEAHMLDGNRTTPEVLLREMSDPDITILKCTNDQGELISCVYGHVQGDVIFSGMLCVRPTLQGSGLGKTMMKAVEDIGRSSKCRALKIQVISARQELVKWYERQGFTPNGVSNPFPPPTIEFGIPKEELVLMEMERPIS